MIDKLQQFENTLDIVSENMKIDPEKVLSRTRKISVVLSRNVLIYIMRKHFNFSYLEIARLTGFKHTTIINSFNKTINIPFLADYSDRLYSEKIKI